MNATLSATLPTLLPAIATFRQEDLHPNPSTG
jgi:hypothetical protein